MSAQEADELNDPKLSEYSGGPRSQIHRSGYPGMALVSSNPSDSPPTSDPDWNEDKAKHTHTHTHANRHALTPAVAERSRLGNQKKLKERLVQ